MKSNDTTLPTYHEIEQANARHTHTAPGFPKVPSSSPWACDPVPPEPPLGIDIDALPDMLSVQR